MTKNADKTRNRKRTLARRMYLLLLGTLLLSAGCGRKGQGGEHVQAVNDIAGFLFHFDQRQETKALVDYKNKDKMPVKVAWYYVKEDIEQVTEAPDAGREAVTEAPDADGEAVTEGLQKEAEAALHAPNGVSEDPKKIAEIYTALNNVIIVGNASINLENRGYYISFTLPDGKECRFDFVSESIMSLSEHNYSIETDGTLWSALEP